MYSFVPVMLLCLKLAQQADRSEKTFAMKAVVSATCVLVAGLGHLFRSCVFHCTDSCSSVGSE